jgi:hypothetical protein
MTTDNFCFYLQNRLIQTSQTGGQWYSDISPLSIPWFSKTFIALATGMHAVSRTREHLGKKFSDLSCHFYFQTAAFLGFPSLCVTLFQEKLFRLQKWPFLIGYITKNSKYCDQGILKGELSLYR